MATCTPSNLASLAACFDCLTTKQQNNVQTYALVQLAVANGLISTTDPKALSKIAESACYGCLTAKQHQAVQNYLLCLLTS